MQSRFFEPLAVIGMAVRLPGATGLSAYWELIRSGRQAVGPLPPRRLDRSLYFSSGEPTPGKTYTDLGGFVDEDCWPSDGEPSKDVDPARLIRSDPAHRVFLRTVLDAIGDSGLDRASLAGGGTGVFVGHARGSPLIADLTYAAMMPELSRQLFESPALSGVPEPLRDRLVHALIEQVRGQYPQVQSDGSPFTQPSAAAQLVAECLGVCGPYMAVDAACAGSFAALDLAARSLQAGTVDTAIVGGCSFNQWSSLILFSQAQALSANGSFPFDQRADGFVSSDGYAAVLVERLDRAIAAGRRIHGVIRGIGASCDGRGKSLWAPLREGQLLAIRRAYAGCGIEPGQIQVLEAHATGTQVGDATELSALAEVFGPRERAAAIPISSVKANIGHTRETAGLAGLVKMLLAMRAGEIAPAAGLNEPTREVDWATVPFRLPRAVEPWPLDETGVRRGAVDAFGIGGLNYHVIVESAEAATKLSAAATPGMVSAAAEAGLPAAAAAVGAGEPAGEGAAELLQEMPARIVIVGLAGLLPTVRRLADIGLMDQRRAAFALPSAQRWRAGVVFGGGEDASSWQSASQVAELSGWSFDWRRHRIPPRQVEGSDPLQFMLIDVVDQALRSAGHTQRPLPCADVGVYVGSMFGTDFTSDINVGLRLPELGRSLQTLMENAATSEQIDAALAHLRQRYGILDESGSFSASTLASRICKHFDLMGPCASIDAEEASAAAALLSAVQLLRAGGAQAVVVCGAQRTLHPVRVRSYEQTGRLGGDDGLHLNEGACAFILMREDDARAQGRRVYGAVEDVRLRSDPAGCWPAMQSLLETAFASEVDLWSTPPQGHREDQAKLTGLLSQRAVDPARVVDAHRRHGFGQGASFAISLLASAGRAAQLEKPTRACVLGVGFRGAAAAAVVHWDGAALSAAMREDAERGELPADPGEQGPSTAAEGRAPAEALEASEPRVWIAEAGEAAGISAAIARALQDAPAAFRRARRLRLDVPFRERWFGSDGGWRVAVVASGPAALVQRLKMLDPIPPQRSAWPALHEQGVFYADPQTLSGLAASQPGAGGLVLCFSGQGSQYEGMFRGLLACSPAAAERMRQFDALLAERGRESFDSLTCGPDAASELASVTWKTQVSVLAADLAMAAALEQLGLLGPASFVLGHSYGEYAALVCAGAWSMASALDATLARCAALDGLGEPPGRLVSTALAPEEAERLSQELGGFVAAANLNSPEQTVLAVERKLVDALLSRLESQGRVGRLLPVPQPFHSALLAGACEPFAIQLEAIALGPPRRPLLSSIGNSFVADPADLRARLVRQLVEPLDFTGLIRRARTEGGQVFVEVGPRTVLTRLIRAILKDQDAVALCSDHPKVPAAEQLTRVVALLACRGVLPAVATLSPSGRLTPSASVVPYSQTRQLPAPVPPGRLRHVDATQRRRARLASEQRQSGPGRGAGLSSAGDWAAATAGAGQPAAVDAMEAALLRFVCEQTGYPPEVVSLDQDLEADLGIDSIKKAQLLGELRDEFQISLPSSAAAGLSLAQFVTLRDVAEFLRGASVTLDGAAARHTNGHTGSPATGSSLERDRAASALPAGLAGRSAAEGSGAGHRNASARPSGVESTNGLFAAMNADRLQVCAGTHEQIGEAIGRHWAEPIRTAMRALGSAYGEEALALPEAIRALEHREAFFDAEALAEIEALGRTADIPPELLVLYNLGLEPSHQIAGCTHLAQTAATRSGALLHAANEDSPMALRAGNCMPRCLMARHTLERVPLVLLASPGLLGGLNGCNARGLSVSSTMLLDQPRNPERLGRVHPLLVLRLLEQARSLNEAIELIAGWTRVGSWSLLLARRESDELAVVEYCDDLLAIRRNVARWHGSNHAQLLRPGEAPAHSLYRMQRLHDLLPQAAADADACQRLLRDRYDHGRERTVAHPTMNTVCRVDNQVSFVIDGGSLAATAGPGSAEPDRFYRYAMDELFSPPPPEPQASPWQRWVLRTQPAEPATQPGAPAALSTLVVGEGALAKILMRLLGEASSPCTSVSWEALPEQPSEGFGRVILLAPALDLFALPPADQRVWLDRLGAMSIRWLGGWLGSPQATGDLVAVTGLGGDFGFSAEREPSALGGVLSGMVKAIGRERPDVRCLCLDHPAHEPAALTARTLMAALAMPSGPVELGTARGELVRPLMLARSLAKENLPAVPGSLHGRRWLVTGGARGIAARLVRLLSARYAGQYVLLGSTSTDEPVEAAWLTADAAALRQIRQQCLSRARQSGQDPDAAWQALSRRIELEQQLTLHRQAGVDFVYQCCDLTDAQAVGSAMAGHAGFDVLLHAAGVEHAADLARKQPARVRATLESKLLGLLHLLAAMSDRPPGMILGFGSVSGRFGGLGQADYSAASDALAKLLTAWRMQTGRPAACIHWPAWDEAGMAQRPESRMALSAAGQAFMPVETGFAALCAELEAGLCEAEVVILDQTHSLDTDSIAHGGGADRLACIRAERAPALLGAVVPPADGSMSLAHEIRLDARHDAFLHDHQLAGTALLPAVFSLEALCESANAALAVTDPPGWEAVDVQIRAALRVSPERPTVVRVESRPAPQAEGGTGRVEARIVGPCFTRQHRLAEAQRVYASGLIGPLPEAGHVQRLHAQEPPSLDDGQWREIPYPQTPESCEDGRVWHGPAMRALTHMQAGGQRMVWGRLAARPPSVLRANRGDRQWLLPVQMLDGCLVACGVLGRLLLGVRSLPSSFERLCVMLPCADITAGWVCAVLREDEQSSLVFDLDLLDDSGTLMAMVRGYRTVVLSRDQNTPDTQAAQGTRPSSAGSRP